MKENMKVIKELVYGDIFALEPNGTAYICTEKPKTEGGLTLVVYRLANDFKAGEKQFVRAGLTSAYLVSGL